ncbi:MAG: hypothetical protein LAN62_18810 [Acidobacteriia bacterium]|nr:hypothetical protein [Terriglobia bacterium]
MHEYYEVDRNSLLAIGLLSSSVHSVLSKLQSTRAATEEQKKILRKAIALAKDVRAGKIAKPTQNENLSLPRPSAAKARKFAIWAWTADHDASGNGQNTSTHFDQIMREYLRLFEHIVETGNLTPDKDETSLQAKRFFARLNRVVVDNLNGLVEEEMPVGDSRVYQSA